MKGLDRPGGQNPAGVSMLQVEYYEFDIQSEILMLRGVSEGSEHIFTATCLSLIVAEDKIVSKEGLFLP